TLSTFKVQDPFVTLLTTLGTYFFAKMNMAIERTNALMAKPITLQEAMNYALDMALLFVAEAFILALIGEAVSDDDDDDKSIAGAVLKESVKPMAAGLPIVRDTAGLAEGFDP